MNVHQAPGLFRGFSWIGTAGRAWRQAQYPRQRREAEVLSTAQANLSLSWKQEVNRRVAAHKNHKNSSAAAPETLSEAHHTANSRAAQAAARVAARYAKAPSYSEVLAEDARAAVRAAEAASWAALEAQAAAQSVLDGLEAASASEPAWQPSPAPLPAAPSAPVFARRAKPSPANNEAMSQPFAIRWEPDMPVRPAQPAPTHATRGAATGEVDANNWRELAATPEDSLGGEEIEVVEPALPIHANLIEFPHELVAARKVRPRLAEGPFAADAEPGAQLSIFEVDPGAISTEPAAAEVVEQAAASSWAAPEWSGIGRNAQLSEELLEEPSSEEAEASAVPKLPLAPLGLRLMAMVVNSSLIAGALLAAAAMAANNLRDLPPLREIEIGAALAFVVVAALYNVLFFTLASATPGMKYAHIRLSTFDGQSPTRAQRWSRLILLLLSLLPVGLGIVWAVFDDNHLCWHDRLSRTYLRKY